MVQKAMKGMKARHVLLVSDSCYSGTLLGEGRSLPALIDDPRIICLIRRWLKAGILEDGCLRESTEGTPQGGSISVLLSNIYLHYVLDLWFERIVKPRIEGEVYLIEAI
jgi:RNA-directed DNA polymerase